METFHLLSDMDYVLYHAFLRKNNNLEMFCPKDVSLQYFQRK